ncbi:hypothetical protein KC973_02115 [Candidatus Saccharibacteria bacterium]|nr:hypothetical protein [Candidatus Saccharibacteria bacterium]
MAAESKTANVKPTYDSNPFTLAFNSFMRMFNTNTVWAVVFLVFGILGALGQFVGNIADIASTPSSTYEQREQKAPFDDDYDYIDSSTSNDIRTSPKDDTSTLSVVAIILIIIGVTIAVVIFGGIIYAVGLFVSALFTYVALQSEKGKTVDFSEAWSAVAKRYWRLLGSQLLAGLKIFGWTLLFIVPGIIAAFRYALLPYVVMAAEDSEKGVKTAHDRTKALVKGRLWEVFGISTVAAVVPFVGSMLQLTGNAALYTQLDHYDKKKLEKPKIHWLNYLGAILLALLFVFVLIVGLIIFLVILANK